MHVKIIQILKSVMYHQSLTMLSLYMLTVSKTFHTNSVDTFPPLRSYRQKISNGSQEFITFGH